MFGFVLDSGCKFNCFDDLIFKTMFYIRLTLRNTAKKQIKFEIVFDSKRFCITYFDFLS